MCTCRENAIPCSPRMKRLDPGTSFHKNSCHQNLIYFLYTLKSSTLLEVLVATPMWNYTVPYVLKQYLDILVQPGINLNEMDNLAEAAIFRNSCCYSMAITISWRVWQKLASISFSALSWV
jgi:hypothetical protein